MKIFAATGRRTARLLFASGLFVAAGSTFYGCAPDEAVMPVGENAATGQVGLLDLSSVTASLEDDASMDGFRAPETRAVDASNYIVKIWRIRTWGEELMTGIPDRLSGFSAPVTLKVANYRLEVLSSELQPAAWDTPWYMGGTTFSIERDQTTAPDEIVCRMENAKVTVRYGESLKSTFWDASNVSVSVTVGENTLTFPYGELRGGFFAVTEPTEMLVEFSGQVSGNRTTMSQTLNIAPGEWARVRFVLEDDSSFPIIVVDKDDNEAGQIGDGGAWF